ncbi:MAG TPA: peptidyl-prolyl cis-trans isomerase [Solirubrobacteraceae bacterium]|nr:peptidyl-prolyl cis-trans isomerase [Solirubrobacteraceae bacterium]
MFRGLHKLAAGGAALLVVGAVAGCGGIPGDAVVSVNGTAITKASFNHWMGVAAASSSASAEGAQSSAPPVPEPPEYTACIKHLEATAAKPAKGKTPPSRAQFKSQCEEQYTAYKQEVLDFLISSQWVLGEAAEQGVKVSEAEVKKQFDTLKKEQFPKESAYKAYLAHSGETEADLLQRVRLQLLARKLQEKITKSAKKKPSKAQIAKYYNEHKAQYGKPESRNLQIVLTKGEAEAKTAKSEIESGKSFASVAKAVSIDPLSKSNGGVLNEVTRGEEEKALSEAVFAAKVGVLSGPVKTPFGYYVFQVTKVNPASQQSLAQSEATIAQAISSQSEQKALSTFVSEFRKKWTQRTECRSGFVVPDCKEYKAPKTSTTTSATG